MDQNKHFISKKYNISINKLHDEHMQYYYTKYPYLCCQYDLQPIQYDINPFDYLAAITYLDTYYKSIKSDYFRNLVDVLKKCDNDLFKCQEFADSIIKEYIKFRKNTFCITIWPFYQKDLKEVVDFLTQYGYVYYTKEIKLDYNSAINLVHQLYSDTNRFPTMDKISEKVDYLGFSKNEKKKIRVIFFENVSPERISGSKAPLKTKIRELLLKEVTGKIVRGDDMVHINDNYYQTIEYSQIFLHKKTLSFLKKQNLENHLKFDRSRLYINTIKQWMIKNVKLIDYERFVIMGSSVLYLYGLRECRDVDGLVLGDGISNELMDNVSKFFYNKETKFSYAGLGITNTKYWDKGWDDKDIPWFKLFGLKYRDELLFNPENYFYFNGMKFVTLKIEILRKYIRHKHHDVGDMLMVMEILGINIKLPQLDINDKLISEVNEHLMDRYNITKDNANLIIKKYLK
jgi:hypothetical protein